MHFFKFSLPVDPIRIQSNFEKTLKKHNITASPEAVASLFVRLPEVNGPEQQSSCPFPLVCTVDAAKGHAQKMKKALAGNMGPSLGKCQQILADFYQFSKWDFFTAAVDDFKSKANNVLFTLELGRLGKEWRWQKDGSWRNLEDDLSLKPSDYITKDSQKIPRLRKTTIEIDGTTYDVNPGVWPSKNESLYQSSCIFRRAYPPEPRLDQLRDVIARGDDSHHNILVLNIDGIFELKYPVDHDDPSIIVRHETYCAGNGYVGVKAASDDSFIKDEFVSSLEVWKEHLVNHQTAEYLDMHSFSGLKEIMQELADIRANWQPQC